MRRDVMVNGMRVVVAGGPHKGRRGELVDLSDCVTRESGQGFRGMTFDKVSVLLDDGRRVEVMPRWLHRAVGVPPELELEMDTHARHSDPPTSHEAAASMVEGATLQRQRLWARLEELGDATADELDVAIGWRDTTAGRRLNELERMGLVEKTGEKRPTRSGRRANVYRITQGGDR